MASRTGGFLLAREQDNEDVERLADVRVRASPRRGTTPLVSPVPTAPTAPRHEEHARKPFPWLQCLLVYSTIASNAVAFSAPVTFLPDFVHERLHVSEEDKGMVVGLLASLFSLGQFLTSFALGHVSDRIGRRPVLLVGMAASATLLAVFGFSNTVLVASLNRFLEGFLNACIPVSKALLSDLTRDDAQHRAEAFAYFGASFGLGRVFGSAAAGFATRIGAPGSVWKYSIPCILVTAPMFVAFAFVCVLLREPRPVPAARRGGRRAAAASAVHRKPSMLQGLRSIFADPVMRLLIIIYCVNSFGNGSVLVCITLLSSLPAHRNGLAFDPARTGIVFTVFGALAFTFQVLFFKRILKRLGVLNTYKYFGCITLTLGVLTTPLATLPYRWGLDPVQTEVAVWAVLALPLLLTAVGFMTLLPMVHTMLSNAADPRTQGLSQGTAQSSASLLRTLGPIVTGSVFSACAAAGMPFIIFVIQGVGYVATLFMAFWLPQSVEQAPGLEEVASSDSDSSGSDEERGAAGPSGVPAAPASGKLLELSPIEAPAPAAAASGAVEPAR